MGSFAWLESHGGIFGVLATFFASGLGLYPGPLVIAVLTPLLLIYGRHEVRLRRLRAIKDFLRSFGSKTDKQASPPDTDKTTGLSSNPSFEFVKSKYISDLQIDDPVDGKFNDMAEIEQIDWIIKNIGYFGSRADWRMCFSTIGLILLTYFGFSALQETLACGLGSNACVCKTTLGALSCEPVEASYGSWYQLAAIGSLAFAGAYIAAIRSFVRALAVFDLTPYTFLRHTVEVVASVLFTIFLFVVFRDPTSAIGDLLGKVGEAIGLSTPAPTPATPAAAATVNEGSINAVWYGLAPLLGLLPQSATQFMLIKFRSMINWMKTNDDRFVDISKIISLDIIDGIDYETRFRLEECGIFDVQNLATYNPIMLHIETPYKIYQTFDWVAQAQLCHILGSEKFLIFREINIRTIFDLERAIGSHHSVNEFDEICAGILFASTSNLKETLQISKTQLTVFENGTAKQVGADEYCLWLRQKIETAGNASPATEHVLRWIADDLHVRRMRRLWLDISDSLGEDSWHLPDNIDAKKKDCAQNNPNPQDDGAQQQGAGGNPQAT